MYVCASKEGDPRDQWGGAGSSEWAGCSPPKRGVDVGEREKRDGIVDTFFGGKYAARGAWRLHTPTSEVRKAKEARSGTPPSELSPSGPMNTTGLRRQPC